MSIPQETIEIARDAMRKFGKSDCAYELAEHILREVGELPPEEPPEEPPLVRVSDCLYDNSWIAVDLSGEVWLYAKEPILHTEYWAPSEMILVQLRVSESLVLPKVPWDKACWTVSELRKMAERRAEWEAKQEPPEPLPEGWIEHTGDVCPVAGDVEVHYRVDEDTEFDETIVDVAGNLVWSQGRRNGRITHYKLANPKPSQMEIYRNALIEIRDSKHCRYESNGSSWYGTGVTDGHRFCAKVAADAILAAGGECDA